MSEYRSDYACKGGKGLWGFGNGGFSLAFSGGKGLWGFGNGGFSLAFSGGKGLWGFGNGGLLATVTVGIRNGGV
ncbi:MAG TPA: hypothetical protein VH302_08820 [Bryobacteraceae bacterium]|nr:hypothetical protein [Bryobacteraceae bacterium]